MRGFDFTTSRKQFAVVGQGVGDGLIGGDTVGGIEKTISIQALAPCEACDSSGSKGNAKARPCRTCGGAGHVNYSKRAMALDQVEAGETVIVTP